MADENFKIFAAPLQGYTEASWRCAHFSSVGGVDSYFTPFLRVEKGQIRNRDLRDISPEKNIGVPVVPQAIFSDVDELRLVAQAAIDAGYSRLDLNLGCPFPPQWKKGRGAGMIPRIDIMAKVSEFIKQSPDLYFSIKMRLGVEESAEYRALMPLINDMPLEYITVHPRVARQQYSGDLHFDEFAHFCSRSAHPIIFNGDLQSVEDIDHIRTLFPQIAGVMIGRGLLARPSLAAQWRNRESTLQDADAALLLLIHDKIYSEYQTTLCGDSQILSKIKPYWDYAQSVIERRIWKAIHKSTTLQRYHQAIAPLR